MKIRIGILSIIMFFVYNNFVFAEDLKVLVVAPFYKMAIMQFLELKAVKEDKDLLEETLNKIYKGIIKKKGFSLSSKEFNSVTQQDSMNETEEYFIDESFGEFFFDLMTPIKKEKYDANLFVMSGLTEDCQKIRLVILAAESGRSYTVDLDIEMLNIDNFSKIVSDTVLKGLNYADQLLSVNADELKDVKYSKVLYKIHTLEKEIILLTVDYDSCHEYIQDINFALMSKKSDGSYTYHIRTNQQYDLNISFDMKDNKIVNYKIDSDFRPPPIEQNIFSNTLTIMSMGGHKIDFDFIWQKDNLLIVNISPTTNPYLPQGITKGVDSDNIIELNKGVELYFGCDGHR